MQQTEIELSKTRDRAKMADGLLAMIKFANKRLDKDLEAISVQTKMINDGSDEEQPCYIDDNLIMRYTQRIERAFAVYEKLTTTYQISPSGRDMLLCPQRTQVDSLSRIEKTVGLEGQLVKTYAENIRLRYAKSTWFPTALNALIDEMIGYGIPDLGVIKTPLGYDALTKQVEVCKPRYDFSTLGIFDTLREYMIDRGHKVEEFEFMYEWFTFESRLPFGLDDEPLTAYNTVPSIALISSKVRKILTDNPDLLNDFNSEMFKTNIGLSITKFSLSTTTFKAKYTEYSSMEGSYLTLTQKVNGEKFIILRPSLVIQYLPNPGKLVDAYKN